MTTLPVGPGGDPDSRGLPVAGVCLVVLDGWGLAPPGPGNAVSLARTPVFDELWSTYPHTTLEACGRAVGLPDGQMGNSEVGHLNLGAGAVIRQDLTRIDDAVAAGELAENEVVRAAFAEATSESPESVQGRAEHVVAPAGRVHLVGLVSDGGVHSSLEHLRALIAIARGQGVRDLVVHAFTDGRDTLPHSGVGFLRELEEAGGARVGSVVGRYWAMDRDRRWDRTQKAYDLLVHGRAAYHADSGAEAVEKAYERGESDEFIAPTAVGEDARIRPGDSVVCFNFRPDRMRQLTRALAEPGFGASGAPATGGEEELPGWGGRGGGEAIGRYATLTEYEEGWRYPVAFPPERPKVTLSGVLARTGARQLHVAETEKYPHVTYFFNGGEEAPLAGERRELVDSPRDVPTYDKKPQMSARAAADAFTAAWSEDRPRFGIVNFANADMVGHTGVIAAAVEAVETVDERLGQVVAAVHATGGVCVVSADHGNADHMLEADGSPNTAHSMNEVPLIVTARGVSLRERGGILADVAPTVLELLGIERPREMTGGSLVERR